MNFSLQQVTRVATSWQMALAVLFLLGLFWSLVYCQTFLRLFFMGQTLANHAYVDISLVGRPYYDGEGVQCITDLATCCNSSQGAHRGDWYFPDGTRLPFSRSGDIYQQRAGQRAYLGRRNNPTSPTGIYRCDIPTEVVHDDEDTSVRDTVYVGLYTGSGGMLLMCPNYSPWCSYSETLSYGHEY